MSVSSIIDSAAQGLRATQAGLDVVSQNVGNAGTVGYTRRVVNTAEVVSGNRGTGVNVVGVQRTLNTLLQKQLRLETAGAAYTGTLATAHTALDAAFDQTEGAASLSSLVNTFRGKLQALAGAPSVYQPRVDVLSAASDLAGSLNSLTDQVQALRQEAETSLGNDVSTANDLLQQIASLNGTMVSMPANAASPALQDQRDRLIDQLSSMMDLKVTPGATGAVKITTTGGLQLVDGQTVVRLSFDVHAIAPESTYSTDPSKRTVGTITATDALGNKTDVVAQGMIRSGTIAANLELRDKILPEAQAQLDSVAAGLSAAMSDKTLPGTAATSGAATGFDLDLSALQSGNTFTLNYTDAAGANSVTFVKVTDPSALPLTGAVPGGAGRTIGIDFSGGIASVASQIQTALGSGFAASNPSGSTIRILDDGASNTTDVTNLTGRATVTTLQVAPPVPPATADAQLPLFVDGGRGDIPYTGSFDGSSQLTGFAGRIKLNAALTDDPSKLVAYT
ncbi:MAG: flagellar hook-associated protein 1, partial [Acidobacteriota bacterium]